MRYRLLLLFAVLVAPVVTSLPVANANHGSTVGTSFCKWDFPWPRTVNYWVSTTVAWPYFPGGYDDSATRISYGGGTWNGSGFNLSFNRVSTTSAATNGYGRVSEHVVAQPQLSTSIADTFIYPNTGCNRDQGQPIKQAVTSWDPDRRFYSDCRAAGTSWCTTNGYYDIHNVAAHEFGHWFHLGHSGDNNHTTNTEATMYSSIGLGEWKKRDLTSDDAAAAAIEYGYR